MTELPSDQLEKIVFASKVNSGIWRKKVAKQRISRHFGFIGALLGFEKYVASGGPSLVLAQGPSDPVWRFGH